MTRPVRCLLLQLLYGRPTWRAFWALEQRCAAAGGDVVDVMTYAQVVARRLEGELIDHRSATRRAEAISRVRRQWPRLPQETAITVVRLAYEGLAVEDAGR